MPQQLSRLLLLFALLGAGLVAARHYLVPETFGRLGHYRAAAIDAVVARNVKYVGRDVCAGCHEAAVKLHGLAHHQTVACEVCHGPGAAHVEAPTEYKPPAPLKRDFCILCHGYDPSRPTGFPQIDPVAHNPVKPCITCHSPHAPEPPHIPEECGACHGQIARTKAVSPHALLLCTRCHETPTRHKLVPRRNRPSQPGDRAFCGVCHAAGAKGPREVPRVDLASHGERYLCWQCHYPHDPELR